MSLSVALTVLTFAVVVVVACVVTWHVAAARAWRAGYLRGFDLACDELAKTQASVEKAKARKLRREGRPRLRVVRPDE